LGYESTKTIFIHLIINQIFFWGFFNFCQQYVNFWCSWFRYILLASNQLDLGMQNLDIQKRTLNLMFGVSGCGTEGQAGAHSQDDTMATALVPACGLPFFSALALASALGFQPNVPEALAPGALETNPRTPSEVSLWLNWHAQFITLPSNHVHGLA